MKVTEKSIESFSLPKFPLRKKMQLLQFSLVSAKRFFVSIAMLGRNTINQVNSNRYTEFIVPNLPVFILNAPWHVQMPCEKRKNAEKDRNRALLQQYRVEKKKLCITKTMHEMPFSSMCMLLFCRFHLPYTSSTCTFETPNKNRATYYRRRRKIQKKNLSIS